MRRLTIALLIAAGCGSDVETELAAHVRIDALLADEVASMSVFVLGPRRSDGIFLTCDTLMTRTIRPTDSEVEILARDEIAFSEPEGYSATLGDVEAGDNRIVYIDARDTDGTVIANGCTEFIEVQSGRSVAVDVDVFRI